MNKLIVVIMGPGKKEFLEMCLDSVKDADKILYWTSSTHVPVDIETFYNGWDESDPATNGKCRQRYLEYLKTNYPNDWCLCIDEDELVEDLQRIKDFVNSNPLGFVYSVKMRHFIGDLGHEDSTLPIHWVPHRLFKISEVDNYPEHSHPILESKDNTKTGNCAETTIWHLGYLPVTYLDYIVRRYNQHVKDSVVHSPKILNNWRVGHLFGYFPTKKINSVELPKQIYDRYELDKDELYFSGRGQLDASHFIMAKQWITQFKPKTVLDLGCGLGHYGYTLDMWGVGYQGLDISKWAVKNTEYHHLKIKQGDIRDPQDFKDFDLVLCVDVLEHLEEKDLDQVLANVKTYGKSFLFSIPFLGDPNLNLDPTHRIKKEKQWWINKLTNHFKIKEVPDYFLFKYQMLMGETK